jgi:predicted Kef-type K+ transport protein
MIGTAVELGIGAGSVQRIFLRVAALGQFIECLELLETQKSKKTAGNNS